MSNTSFWDHPIEKLEEALHLKKQIHALQEKLSSLFSSDDDSPPKRGPGRPPKAAPLAGPSALELSKKRGRKPFSAETKAKMAAAQRARWAAKTGTGVASPLDTLSAAPKTGKKGKRVVSPEVRARLAAAMKARWAAAKRKGLPGPNARK